MLAALAARASDAADASVAIFLISGRVRSPLPSFSPLALAAAAKGRSAAATCSGLASLLLVTFCVSESFVPSSFIEPISNWHSGPFLLHPMLNVKAARSARDLPSLAVRFMWFLLRGGQTSCFGLQLKLGSQTSTTCHTLSPA